jgi:peptidoglycan/LPS O-acetylase OafA/YrhL
MSIFWIILGHRIHLQFPWANPTDYRAFMNERIISTPFHTHHLAVDTFLIMGALLMTWSTLKDCEKQQLNILRMIWRRYLRYTPVFAALVFAAASIFRFAFNGPLFLDMLRDNCVNNWWWALLHIQNYLPPSEMCINHSWYLSIDFQLFVISPFIIYLIHKFGKKGLSVPAILCVGTMIYIFSIAMVLNIEMPRLASGEGDDPIYSKYIYFPTQSRAGPWFIGIILGYFLYIKRGEKIKVNKFFNAFMWIASLSLLCTVVFLSFAFSTSTREIAAASHASFMALQRNLWGVAICWIVFACQNLKTGGIIRWFLSLPQWQPISRMGLSMYLLSATYQVTTILNQRVPLYMNFWHLVSEIYIEIIP